MDFASVDNSYLTPLFLGNSEIAYRDPACYLVNGTFYLFMTVSHKRGEFMFNTVGVSKSTDLISWSKPEIITEFDLTKNYCSPGNVLRNGDEYIICVTSYPMPFPYTKQHYADESARLFTIRTKDFETFSKPELIMAKGDMPAENMGRMIDPYIFSDINQKGLYHLFFKQNGVSHSHSSDLINWEYDGFVDGGENACVITKDNLYYLIHSPENGIGIKTSRDLANWESQGIHTLGQSNWDWASGRLTAGFAMEAPDDFKYKYLVFFHASRADAFPETHGEASIAMVFTDDFEHYFHIK